MAHGRKTGGRNFPEGNPGKRKGAKDEVPRSFKASVKRAYEELAEPPEGEAQDGPAGGGVPSGNGDIYTECLLRTATNDGMIVATFTPLRGLTPFIDHYLETADLADATGRLINAKVGLFGEK